MAKPKTLQPDPAPVKCSSVDGLPDGTAPTATAVADPPIVKPTTGAAETTPPAVLAVARREREISEGAETVFKKLAAGHEVSADERALLRALGPTVIGRQPSTQRDYDRWLRFEVARLQKVAKLQSRAGSTKEREEASKAAEKAEGERDRRGPEIEAELTRLQSEKMQLAQAAEQARAASDYRQQVLRELQRKDILPLHIRDDSRAAENEWSQNQGHALEVKRNRLAVLERLGALDVSERRRVPGGFAGGKDLPTVVGYIEGCAEFGPDPRTRQKHFGLITERTEGYWHNVEVVPDNLDRRRWQAHLDGPVADERLALLQEIAGLEKLEAQHNAAMTALTDFYVPT